ncbi:MAG: hypothetical protein QNK40_11110 [Desulfobacterales bacterium]|nr:hypothetical protein [Desulfobacterales bacterium]
MGIKPGLDLIHYVIFMGAVHQNTYSKVTFVTAESYRDHAFRDLAFPIGSDNEIFTRPTIFFGIDIHVIAEGGICYLEVEIAPLYFRHCKHQGLFVQLEKNTAVEGIMVGDAPNLILAFGSFFR